MNRMQGVWAGAACGVLLFVVGCGGGSSHLNVISHSGSNVQPITVSGGPTGQYVDGAFTSVTVCTPGTSTCQTIDGVLVDTGSSGLRILSSVLTIPLTQQHATDGNPVVECLPFLNSYTWGPVQTADVQIAGEKANSLPIQVLSDSDYPVPTSCSDNGPSADTISSLGANGLLGVGSFAQDCGGACVSTGASNPERYYECPAAGCSVVGESLAQQVQNPVVLFATDNNGVVLELPAASSPAVSISGSLIFGIGTQSNNALNGATIYILDPFGNFATTYNGQSYSGSFLDSGSNGVYFLTSAITGLPGCGGFYCPATTQNLSATNKGANGVSGTVNFSVGNADDLFNNNPMDAVLGDLAGPGFVTGFDWGLPFFFGRNVFTSIAGQTSPGGNQAYWAY
jgi:Protein of unknown function (DUF3443)